MTEKTAKRARSLSRANKSSSSSSATANRAAQVPPQVNPDDDRMSSLLKLVVRDLDPEGSRILLPFFTTTDLLRLSECCRELLKYRLYLSRVKIVPHPLATPAVRKGLVRLLVEQQLGVQYLRVEDRSMMTVLDLVAWGCCERLKTLDLSGLELTDEDAAHVGRALGEGGLRSLECLNLAGCGRSKLTTVGLGFVATALTQGACPCLRRLKLSYHVSMGPGAGQLIADILNSGHCQRLEELELKNTPLRQEGFVEVARAFQLGRCPDLRRLSISGCFLTPADGRALGHAVLSACFPKLEELEMFGNNNLGDEGHDLVFQAIETGCCTNLEVLHLGNADLKTDGATALGNAISSGNCRRLRSLNFYGGSTDPAGMLHILNAIKGGGCPLLRHINLSLNKLDQKHGRALGEAMMAGVCSNLEDMVLSMNETLGDEGVLPITEAMACGRCPELKQLRMSVVGMSSISASSLARAFGSGYLSRLQGIKLQWNRAVEDQAMTEIVRGLAAGPPRDLRSISALGTIMKEEASQALLEVIREGAWPKLEELAVAVETSNITWVEELASTFTMGTVPNLQHLNMSCTTTMEGLYELDRILQQGALPALQDLSLEVTLMEAMDERQVEEVKQSLSRRVKTTITFNNVVE